MMLPLLVWSLAPVLAADEDTAAKTGEPVDTTAYLNALTGAFLSCVTAEGTALSGDDESAVQQALMTMAPILSFAGITTQCTATAAAADACTTWVRAASCADLQGRIEAVINGEILVPGTPDWAVSYGDALGSRIGACYALEIGRPLDESEEHDVMLFRTMMAGTVGQLAAACPPDPAAAARCTEDARTMDCAVLAGYATATTEQTDTGALEIDNEMVSRLLTRCDGFLDCSGQEAAPQEEPEP